MHYTAVGDKGAALLTRLPSLERLVLRNTRVTDETLRRLSGNQTILRLDVSMTSVGDDGLRYLASAPFLEILNLGDTVLSDKGLEHLSVLRHVRELDVDGTRVTDDGLRWLDDWPLEKLQVSRGQITRQGIARFEERPPACRVRIRGVSAAAR